MLFFYSFSVSQCDLSPLCPHNWGHNIKSGHRKKCPALCAGLCAPKLHIRIGA